MDPGQALAELKQISAQVQDAVIFDESGGVVASTLAEERAPAMAQAARRLLENAAGAVERGEEIVQLEAALPEGSVIVAREGSTAVAATTVPDPTVGLIFYDLRTCLRALVEPEEKPKSKQRRKPPAEKTPAERETAERETAEKKPAEKKPAEKKPAERETAERETAERETAERETAEKKPAERKPAERKPAEKKPAEKKEEDAD